MQLEHTFRVPLGVDEAWKVLVDIDRIGPCLPGAVIDSVNGDDVIGTVKVKLGPINLAYEGKASFVEKDEAARRAVIDAQARDTRGNGTAAATFTATLSGDSDTTTVQVNTDLDLTGKPAQFGRGVMVDVGSKLLGQFADALAATLKGDDTPPTDPAAVAGSAASDAAPAEPAEPAKRARPRPTRASAPTTEEQAAGLPPIDTTPETPQPEAEPAERAEPNDPAAEAASAQPADTAPAQPAETAPAHPADVGSVNGHRRAEQRPATSDAEPIELIKAAGPALGKRLAGPAAVALVIALLAAKRRRRDSD